MTVFVDMSEVQRWGGLLDTEAVQVGRRVEIAVSAQTVAVQGRAAAQAPKGATGALAGSVRSTGKGLRRRVKAGNSKAYYAGFQEFGTRKMDANPYLIVQVNPGSQSEFETRVDRALGQGAIYQ